MKLHTEFEQGSLEWMQARAGIVTASELDALVSPTWEIRKGQMPATYLAKKVAESWLGGPLADFTSWDMEQGQILQQEAADWYSLEYGKDIRSIGFITTDDGRVGCSPDGLLGDDSGIEIKCPESWTHVNYLLGGGVPKEYLAQCHGSMLVTGFPRWTFVSYRRHFPKLVATVERDEKIQAVIAEAIAAFLQRFDTAMAKIEDANGGPNLQRLKKFYDREPEYADVIP